MHEKIRPLLDFFVHCIVSPGLLHCSRVAARNVPQEVMVLTYILDSVWRKQDAIYQVLLACSAIFFVLALVFTWGSLSLRSIGTEYWWITGVGGVVAAVVAVAAAVYAIWKYRVWNR